MPRSARYSVSGERNNGTDLHILKDGFGRLREIGGFFPSGHRHVGGFRYELRLRPKVIALQKLPGKREDVAALAQTEVVPELFRHVHTERGCALAPVRGKIPQLVTAPSNRLMPQPCEKIRKRHPSDSIYFRPFHARVS